MKLQERVTLLQQRHPGSEFYVIVNNIDRIRRITDRFDDPIRMAVIHPHEIRDSPHGLLQKCE